MSDSSQVSVYYLEESTPGTFAGGDLKQVRVTGESLTANYNTTTSNEIRDDRQITDVIRTGSNPGGGINYELSYGNVDDLMAGAFYDEWVGVGGTTTETITSGATVSQADFVLSDVANTISLGSNVTHDIVAGQWIKLSGSTADDGVHYVSSVNVNEITVAAVPGITTAETLDEVSAAVISGARLRNGTAAKSFSLEKNFNDVTKFMSFTGMHVSQMQLTVAAEQVLSGSIEFVGMTADPRDTTAGTGTTISAPTNDVMSASTHVSNVRENETDIVAIRELSFTVANNLRAHTVVGSDSPSGVGAGRCAVTGQATQYFSDFDLYKKFVDGDRTSIDYRATDAHGNAYVIQFPEVKFTNATITAGGADQDVEASLGFQALADSTLGYTVQVCRFAA